MADRGFPGPYEHSIRSNDEMMKRVPMDKTDIGANSPSQPKDMTGREMRIEHVSNKST